MRLVESMQRQLPVLLARAVVASSTSQVGSTDNTLKDKKRSEELSVAGALNKACEVQVTITIKIEKGKDQTTGKTQESRDKRSNNESISESEDKHKDDDKRKKRSRSSDNEIRLSRFAFSEDQCDYRSAQASRITENNLDEDNAIADDSDNVVNDASAKILWI